MANFKWRTTDGRFDLAFNWANTTLRINPARVPPGAGDSVTFDTGGGTISGAGSVGSLTMTGNNAVPWIVAGQLVADTAVIDAHVAIAGRGALDAATVSVGATAQLAVESGAVAHAGELTLSAASHLNVAVDALFTVGSAAGVAGAVRVGTSATLITHGAAIQANVEDDGLVASDAGTVILGDLSGTGSLVVGAGLTTIEGRAGLSRITFSGTSATLRVQGLHGTTQVGTFVPGDAIDLPGVTAFALTTTGSGAVLAAGGGTLQLDAAPAGSAYAVYGDGRGGIELLLDSPPPANAVEITDVVTKASSLAAGEAYAGPVNYLQRQFIAPGPDAVALRANTPNVFLKGGPSGDALQVLTGNNVLDGGAGSNFLVGGDGSDGGQDTFFVDGRGGQVTWSTIVNFHPGDKATIFGFHAGLSTQPYTDSDGAAGYTGLTLHSELNGGGTGIVASLTLAGIDRATVSAHFSVTAGTLEAGTAQQADYLLLEWDH